MSLTLSLLAIAGLLAFGAFFAGSETALTAVSRARMHHLAQEGSRRARYVNELIDNRERLIGAMLLGNTFVEILASSLAASLALKYFMSEAGVVLTSVVLTVIVLIFVEVLPKTLAIARTDRMALGVALPARLFVSVLWPVVAAVQFIVWRVLWLFGIRGEQGEDSVVSAHEEIRGAIDLHHQEGSFEREHRDMLGGILNLRELKVGDAMVHRKNMVIIDGDAALEETIELILSSGHTRFPIWKDDPENIVGVLHMKDVLREMKQRRGSLEGLDIVALAVEPWFVPDATTLEEQVGVFRERRAHFALVVDEYGTLQGLITLEDILEVVFGTIGESHDMSVHKGIHPQPDGSYTVDGTTPIRELNRELEWKLPDEAANTIAGLVIHEARIIPDVGQTFSFHGFKFEVLRRKRNQILALRITPPKPDSGETRQPAA